MNMVVDHTTVVAWLCSNAVKQVCFTFLEEIYLLKMINTLRILNVVSLKGKLRSFEVRQKER